MFNLHQDKYVLYTYSENILYNLYMVIMIYSMYMCMYMLYVDELYNTISHLLSLHFILVCSSFHFASSPVGCFAILVTLMCLSYHHLYSYSLMRNDNVTTTSYAYFTFINWQLFNHYPLDLSWESVRGRWSIQPLMLTVSN